MKNNKYLKFFSTVLVAILIVTIAPINDAIVSELKSSANSVVKSIGEAVEDIDLTLPEINLKAEAAGYATYMWNAKTSTLTIDGNDDMPDYSKLTAPWAKYNKAKHLVIIGTITSIGANAFMNFNMLEDIVIVAPVKNINGSAFEGCSSVTSITLPNTLLAIYKNAFKDCISLKNIVIPDSVTKIMSGVFEGCYLESLTTPLVGGGPDNKSEQKTDQLGYMFGTTEYENTYSVKSRIDSSVYYYIPYSLKKVILTKRLYKYNFENAIGIEEIVIADTVTATGYPNRFAFGCKSLKKVVTNADGLTGVGAEAFRCCEVLDNFVIPDSVEWIGEYTFDKCYKLSSITFPSGDFYTRRFAFTETEFWNKKTEDFVIVGDGVLIQYNGTDTDVVVPENVKRISCAFDGRSDILSVKLPEGLKYISTHSFYGCFGITELVVPKSVIEISEEAFEGLCKLESLTVPFIGKNRDVKSDSEEALISYWFRHYTNNNVCYACHDSTVAMRKYQYYNDSKSYRKIYQPENLKKLTITGGMLHSKCITGLDIYEVTVGVNVEGIEPYGLYNAGIYKLNIDENWIVEEFPDYSFAKNHIAQVVLPKTIKRLGAAFAENPLASITLHEGIEEIDGTFRSTWLTSIELPSTLTKISGKAFKSCKKLSGIYIGENVQEISSDAFIDTNLKGIYVDDINEHYFDEDGILYDKDGVLFAYPSGNTSDTYYISERVTSIPTKMLDQFVNIAKFVVDENNENYFSCDGVLYKANGNLVKYPDKKTDTTYVIDSRVSSTPYPDDDYVAHIAAVLVIGDNPNYTSIDGVLYNKDVTTLRWYPRCKTGDYVAPDTVKTVKHRAFYRANAGKVEFPNDVEFKNECFCEADMTELIAVNFTHPLGYLFSYSYNYSQPFVPRSLRRLVVTNQTSDIPWYFATDLKLDELIINGSFTRIGDHAFWGLKGCKELILPDTVEQIGEYAFRYAGFEEIYLGTSLKTIEENAFSGSDLKRLDLPDTVEYIGGWAFSYVEMTSVNMSANVTYIGKYAFVRTIFTEIDLPDTVEYIGDGAFTETMITEINLGDKITYIGYRAFGGSMLKKAVISENLADMSDEIFLDCKYLETVVVGGAVESIGEEAFGNCTALETVVIPSNVTEINDEAFLGANEDLVIYCNEGSYAQEYAAKNNIKYTTLVIDPIENQTYTGREIEPEVNASANNRRLTKDTEFTVSYKDNINVGTAKVIAKGLGDFKHLAATAQFAITPKPSENIRVISGSSSYRPKGVKPQLYVYSGATLLVEGKDFEIIENELLTDAGEYNIALSLMGNYYGIINITYEVSRRSIKRADIEYGDTIKITCEGVTLEEGKDYIVIKETKENGDVVTTIEGIGNYKGTDTHTERNSNGQTSLNWFQQLIEAIRSLFDKLFNIGL